MANATKTEMVAKVAQLGNTTKKEAEHMLDTVVAAMEETAIVDLRGFKLGAIGSIRLVDKKAQVFKHITGDGTTTKPNRKNLKLNVNKGTQKAIEEATAE